MANWKEVGFVPDSDEEDLLDSQSTSNDGLSRDDSFHDVDEYDDQDDAKPSDRGIEGNLLGSLADLGRKGNPSASIYMATDEASQSRRYKSTSPRPKSFHIPPGYDSIIGPSTSEGLQENDTSRLPSAPPANQAEQSNDDAISKSYVQLLSAASSPLSSAPDSPIESESPKFPSLPYGLWSSSPDELAEGHQVVAAHEDPILHTGTNDISKSLATEAIESTRVRSFRERRPIQLHPYAMEEARYRRTALASGIKPVKVTQHEAFTQHRRHHSESQDNEFEAADESQSLLGEANQPPSSSLPQPSSQPDVATINRDNFNEPGDDEDDDDLPDINELLQGTQIQHPDGKKGPKGRHLVSNAIFSAFRVPENDFSSQPLASGADIWDIPSSPPTRRSPVRASKNLVIHRSQEDIATSPSSRRASFQTDQSLRNSSLDPITPATSVVTPIVDLTNVVDEVSDDPFATSEESGSEAEPNLEPDDSLQVQRVGRRIRGVLPASWLRLDQKTKAPQETKQRPQISDTGTPGTTQPRRGVALPVSRRHARSPSISQADHNMHGMPFLSDDSDRSDTDIEIAKIRTLEKDPSRGFMLSQVDSVREDDRVDAMLPSRKRSSPFQPTQNRSKKLRVHSSLFPESGKKYQRQPKITEQFSEGTNEPARGTTRPKPKKLRRSYTHKTSRQNRPKPFRLSILDVVPQVTESRELPQFVRIAARNARSRRDLGRHSPTRKFIRLANIADTEDANVTLREWRSASIAQSAVVSATQRIAPRKTAGRDTISHSHSGYVVPDHQSMDHIGINLRGSKKLLISKLRQAQLGFPEVSEVPPQDRLTRQEKSKKPIIRKRARPDISYAVPARQVQLERLETEYNSRHPVAAFVSTKRSLDALYRRSRKENAAGRGMQLNRFLADDDALVKGKAIGSTIKLGPQSREVADEVEVGKKKHVIRRRKVTPVHLDAGAVHFRQPTESAFIENMMGAAPLVPDHKGGKLLGLGNYGCQYTSHFDIFALDSNVFFHESTFVGSGRLARVIDNTLHRDLSSFAGYCSHQLEEKELQWGAWDEQVSSEFGLCFVWLADNLELASQSGQTADATKLRATMDFVVRYVEYHLSFSTPESRSHFLSRVHEVLQNYVSRVQALSAGNGNHTEPRAGVETTIRVCTLLMLVLQIAKGTTSSDSLHHQLEIQLQKACAAAMDLLFHAGLENVRGFYEDCQLLSYREAGIRSHLYIVEAWVVLTNILSAANIPRSSFWDIFNSRLLKEDISVVVDARVLEKMWYAMFSLLPLTAFNEYGVCHKTGGARPILENWILPQRLAKRVFTLYSQSPKQSPSFNEYCRTIFHRCHNLITHWHWERCGSIVGTLFDFFASHKLAHLRNEESFKSPHFLQELSGEPSLAVESGDLCFHILLKIIATAIKQFHRSDDLKSVRNLVTRVLPNHNRQYPKEEPIHISDLASLRNHHDLLSTLFWAAPPQSRPSITLLRDLVIPGQAHNEACLIQLQTWTNMASFIFVHEPHGPALKEMVQWHTEFVSSFIVEREAVQTSLHKLLQELAANSTANSFCEADIRNVAAANMASASEIIGNATANLNKLSSSIKDFGISKTVFEDHIETTVRSLRGYDRTSPPSQLEEITKYLEMVDVYIKRVNQDFPWRASQATNEDSQDYGDDADLLERHWAAEPCDGPLINQYGVIMSELLESHHDTGEFGFTMTCHWGNLLAFFLTSARCDVVEIFGENGKYNKFGPSASLHQATKFESCFVVQFLRAIEETGDFDLFDRMNNVGLDIATVVFRNLASPDRVRLYSEDLVLAVLSHHERHHLINDAYTELFSIQTPAIILGSDLPRISEAQKLAFFEIHLKKMQEHLQLLKGDGSLVTRAGDTGRPGPEVEVIYHLLLRCLATDVQQFLLVEGSQQRVTGPNNAIEVCFKEESASRYVSFVENLARLMARYTNHIYPADKLKAIVLPFMKDPEVYEQKYFEDKLAAYGRTTTLVTTNHALLHFCLGTYRVTAAYGSKLKMMCNNIANVIVNGLQSNSSLSLHDIVDNGNSQSDQSRLAIFLLSQLLPALTYTAYHTEYGWALAEPYLLAAIQAIEEVGGEDDVALMRIFVPVLWCVHDGLLVLASTNMEGTTPVCEGQKRVTVLALCLLTAALPHIVNGMDLARALDKDQSSARNTERGLDLIKKTAYAIINTTEAPALEFGEWMMCRPFQQQWQEYARLIIANLAQHPILSRQLLYDAAKENDNNMLHASLDFIEELSRLQDHVCWKKRHRQGGFFTGLVL